MSPQVERPPGRRMVEGAGQTAGDGETDGEGDVGRARAEGQHRGHPAMVDDGSQLIRPYGGLQMIACPAGDVPTGQAEVGDREVEVVPVEVRQEDMMKSRAEPEAVVQ
ncbi:hypothetical protein [Streptomyces sp. NPDC059894]|uniref:hypothetical protein n=1 Tax=unclassified Streptomyces TaxID=2593676 RepID=UPI003668983A